MRALCRAHLTSHGEAGVHRKKKTNLEWHSGINISRVTYGECVCVFYFLTGIIVPYLPTDVLSVKKSLVFMEHMNGMMISYSVDSFIKSHMILCKHVMCTLCRRFVIWQRLSHLKCDILKYFMRGEGCRSFMDIVHTTEQHNHLNVVIDIAYRF